MDAGKRCPLARKIDRSKGSDGQLGDGLICKSFAA